MKIIKAAFLWFATLSVPIWGYVAIPILWESDKLLAVCVTPIFMIAFLVTLQDAIEGRFR